MQEIFGLDFYFGNAIAASFQRFALESIPGSLASAFHRGMAATRTKTELFWWFPHLAIGYHGTRHYRGRPSRIPLFPEK